MQDKVQYGIGFREGEGVIFGVTYNRKLGVLRCTFLMRGVCIHSIDSDLLSNLGKNDLEKEI